MHSSVRATLVAPAQWGLTEAPTGDISANICDRANCHIWQFTLARL